MKQLMLILLLCGFATQARLQVLPGKTAVKANSQAQSQLQQSLEYQYQLEHYETRLLIRMQRGNDDMRTGQRMIITAILTDGTCIQARQNNIPLSAEEVFPKIPNSNWGAVGLSFRGPVKRLHKVEIVVFEESRNALQNEDVLFINRMEIKASVTDKKQNRVLYDQRIIHTESISLGRIRGAGVISSGIINPRIAYPSRLKTDMETGLYFRVLNDGDAIKEGYSMARLLVELKTGGIIETDINGGTKSFYFIQQQTGTNVKWTDIKRIGLRYIYPSNAFNRDDWKVKGVAVDFNSPYLGPVRIYTNWALNKKMNGDGAGTTWWSDALSLP